VVMVAVTIAVARSFFIAMGVFSTSVLFFLSGIHPGSG